MKTYPKDEGCAYCGASHAQAIKDTVLMKDELLSHLECPECGRDGCEVCMPAGVGCVCPECDEGD